MLRWWDDRGRFVIEGEPYCATRHCLGPTRDVRRCPMAAVDRSLLDKARRTPQALRLEEVLRLTRQLGFAKVRQVRGHRIFRHPRLSPLNLQETGDGRAKAWQVRRLVEAARTLRHA